MNIKQIPINVNFTKGRSGHKPEVVVCHIMDGTLVGTRSWFANPKSKASAHFCIGKNGEIEQFVKIEDRAWHAGSVRNPKIKLPYPASVSPNLYTIGIEFEGFSGDVMPEAQYQAGLWLIKELRKQLPSRPLKEQVIGHFQINSIDKANCPGSGFPWARLYADLDDDPLAKKLSVIGVTSPEYWLENARPGKMCKGELVASLIDKMVILKEVK